MPGSPVIRGFFDEATNTISYLVADPQTGDAAIIDPVLDYKPNSGTVDVRSVDAILAGIGWKMDDDVAQQLFQAGHKSPLSNNPAAGHFANPFLPTTERYSYVEQVAPIVARLHECEPTKVEWLWPGRIAVGKITMIAGEPGLGGSGIEFPEHA